LYDNLSHERFSEEPGGRQMTAAMERTMATTAHATSFIGRKSELELAVRVLAESRLLTIIGPSGVGKSRLAERLADRMDRTHPSTTVRIDLRGDPREPVAIDLLALREHDGLVVLDDADGSDRARVIAATVLADCPDAVVVVTGTSALGIDGEHLLELRPFHVPPRAQASSRVILEYDAVRLLVDRIRLHDPGFSVTTPQLLVLRDICAAADGLPATIELAAAATRVLSLEATRHGLSSPDSIVDVLPGAEWIGANALAVVTSCDALEHRVLTVASLLREPLTIDCLSSLAADDDAARNDLVAAFCRLVDRSVLISDADTDGAFRVLRAVRRAARADLDAAGMTAATTAKIDRHLVELMESLADSPPGPDEVQLSLHLMNHRSSLKRFLARYASEEASAAHSIRLILRLRNRWSALGLVTEVQSWLEEAIKSRALRDALTADALRAEAYFSILGSDFQRSAELLAESLAVPDSTVSPGGMPSEVIEALVRIGKLDIDGAESLLEGAVERSRSSGNLAMLDEQMYFLTLANVIRGDHSRAEQLFRTSVELMRARGNRWGMAHALIVLSISLLNRGLDERAGETAREALLMMDSLGDRTGLPTCLRLLATLAQRRGESARAATLLAAAGRLHGSRTPARDTIGWGVEAAVRRSLGAREFSRHSARGRQLDRREMIVLALDDGTTKDPAKPSELTRRESEIATLLVEGLSSAEIAARLVLSTRTVEGHIQRMLHKLQFRSRSQIAVWMSERLDAPGVRVLAG
jgi:non-specific serine/threonine protein kinase